MFLLTVFSCKKGEHKIEHRYAYVDDSLLANYFFPEGSYWVYKDQNNQIDSIVNSVNTNGFTTTPCPHGCPSGIINNTEFYKMTLKNVTKNESFNYYFTSNYIRLNGGGNYSELGQPIFIYNETLNHEFNGATTIEKLDVFELNGVSFQNVTKVKITYAEQYQNEFRFDTDLYFAEKIGLIKQTVYDTINGVNDIELIRFKVPPS